MTKPRQLAPTVGPAHGGVEFLEESFPGFREVRENLDQEEPDWKGLHLQSMRFALKEEKNRVFWCVTDATRSVESEYKTKFYYYKRVPLRPLGVFL